MIFKMYFLLDRTKSIMPKDFIDMALTIPGFSFEVIDDNDVVLNYHDNNIIFDAKIFIKAKSIIPNIHLLNAQYKNINMHIELPFTYPDYKVSLFIDKITLLIKQFNLAIYCECFDDVLPFKKDDVMYAYSTLKKAYMEKNNEEFVKFYKVDKMKLTDFLTYENEYIHAIKHYSNIGITVPKLLYYVDEISGNVSATIEWDGMTNILIPPFIDYIYYKGENENRIILAKEFVSQLKKYIDNLQSFLPGTKVVSEKKITKCQKAIKKAKFTMVLKKFLVVSQTALID
ncbi:MAG: hypothetical protein J6Y28_05580 [Acholeplasmatales bacterium]|nr:hypothetical protein [Acholeplasmatales bacterium]